MNRINRTFIISLIFILISSSTFAIKPFRVGIRAGIPNVVSINAEYVLPILGHRVAPIIDFSDFSLTVEDVNIDFTYLEAGANFYLSPNGKWLYANVSYINMKTSLEYTDVESINGQLIGGTATADVNIKSLSIKLGAKLGGTFYIRPEIGFLASPLADKVTIQAEFTNGYQEEQTEDVPSVLTGSFIFNIGFGIAF